MRAPAAVLGAGKCVHRVMEKARPETWEETQDGIGHGDRGKRLFPVGGWGVAARARERTEPRASKMWVWKLVVT